jgi:hypothetical protein
LAQTITIPEKISKRRIIVYKPCLDLNVIRQKAEKQKTDLFTKYFFLKPNPTEIRVVAIEKYYEPYLAVSGEYTIEYSRPWVHTIEVAETLQELTLFGQTFTPEPLSERLEVASKLIKLVGEGRFRHKHSAFVVFDRKWQEVGIDRLPYVPFEEHPLKVLKSLDKRSGAVKIPPGKDVDLLRSKIAQRPPDIQQIHNELFAISGRDVIYKPMFKITFRNLKTTEEATSIIDAVTGHEEHVRPPVFKSYPKRLTESKEKLLKATKKLFRNLFSRKAAIPPNKGTRS